MKRYITLFTASLIAVCTLAQMQFTSGKFKYEVLPGTDNMVQIIPKSNSERKLSAEELMLLNCSVGELLRVPWTARRSNQSILKEIGPEYSLEGLMLKLKFQ